MRVNKYKFKTESCVTGVHYYNAIDSECYPKFLNIMKLLAEIRMKIGIKNVKITTTPREDGIVIFKKVYFERHIKYHIEEEATVSCVLDYYDAMVQKVRKEYISEKSYICTDYKPYFILFRGYSKYDSLDGMLENIDFELTKANIEKPTSERYDIEIKLLFCGEGSPLDIGACIIFNGIIRNYIIKQWGR